MRHKGRKFVFGAAVVGAAILFGRLLYTSGDSLGSDNAGSTEPLGEPSRQVITLYRPQSSTADSPKAEETAEIGSLTAASTNSLLERVAAPFKFSNEQLAEYLLKNGTNVETLLVAAQLGDDRTGYFKLAAKLFPDDPRVQFAIVVHDVLPEAKREWLERFKQSAPDNALAGFLSAREYLKSGDRTSAYLELLDAAGKPHFDDYTLDAWQTTEEAQLQAGRSPAEAKASAAWGLWLPHLGQLRGMANEMEAWQKEYRAGGEMAAAEELARIGAAVAQHLKSGDGSHYLINQLVGTSMERSVLNQLPPDGNPAFLHGTVQQRLDELSAFRKESKQLVQHFNHFIEQGGETAIISFYDRMKVQGEYATLKWVQQRQAPARTDVQ